MLIGFDDRLPSKHMEGSAPSQLDDGAGNKEGTEDQLLLFTE